MVPFFSIVIPVYQVEEYLKECVDSFLLQSYKDYEIILIDNGSTDKSGYICDEYANKYDFIKVIHLEKNQGISGARNTGLKECSGKYVFFSDSDDYFTHDRVLYRAKEKLEKTDADILFFKCTYYSAIKDKYIENPAGLDEKLVDGLDIEDGWNNLMSKGAFMISAWSKIVRKELLDINKIEFEKNLIGEDVDWSFMIMQKAEKITAINDVCYFHRMRRNSTAFQQKDKKSCEDLMYVLNKWAPCFEKNIDNKKLKESLMGYLSYQFYILIGRCYFLEKKERKALLSQVKELDFLSRWVVDKKTKIGQKVYKILGLEKSVYIFGLYIRYIIRR